MADESVDIKVVRLEEKLNAFDSRLRGVEGSYKDLYDVAVSVKLLAGNLDRVIEIQKKQDERISNLENVPSDTWKTIKGNAINAIVSAIIGGIVTFIGLLLNEINGG